MFLPRKVSVVANVSFIESKRLIELVRQADPNGNMKIRVLTGHRLAIGSDPLAPTHVIDLSKEKIESHSPRDGTQAVPAAGVPLRPAQTNRRSGTYTYKLRGRSFECRSLKEMLRLSLESIEQVAPGTLERLSQIKPRSKRIVAREPRLLFDSPNLVSEYSEKLANGWWFGTNNSAQETKAWLQRAVECAGLRWGPDFDCDI